MIIEANDRMLFIKRAGVFIPVACLTNNGLSESVDLAPTTTRQSGGWETARPLTQRASISFEGLSLDTIFFSDIDEGEKTTVVLTFAQTGEFLSSDPNEYPLFLQILFGDTVIFNQDVTFQQTVTLPTGVLKGATISQTLQNFVNLILPIPFANVSVSGNTVRFEMFEMGEYSVSQFTRPEGLVSVSFETVIIQNPITLVSYDRLKIIKRNRERIEWRIQSPNPFKGKYIDEGEGYISDISDNNPVNEDSSFSGSITVYGEPRIIFNNLALAASATEALEDGDENLITP